MAFANSIEGPALDDAAKIRKKSESTIINKKKLTGVREFVLKKELFTFSEQLLLNWISTFIVLCRLTEISDVITDGNADSVTN